MKKRLAVRVRPEEDQAKPSERNVGKDEEMLKGLGRRLSVYKVKQEVGHRWPSL